MNALRSDGPPLVLGGTAGGGGSSDVPKILRDTIGLNMRLVVGYRDSAAIYLAMENGEVSGRTNEVARERQRFDRYSTIGRRFAADSLQVSRAAIANSTVGAAGG